MEKKLTFKKDIYWKTRGKYSRCLRICCRKCGHLILTYQKDGAGNIRRLYLDRIFSLSNFFNLQNKKLEKISALKCAGCKEILGVPYIYPKEKRKAFRLFQDSIIKKVIKLN